MDKKIIEDYLLKHEVSPSNLGFPMLVEAVDRYEQGKCKTMELYADIGQLYDTSAICAERNIRHAISKSNIKNTIPLKKNGDIIAYIKMMCTRLGA